MKIEKPKSLKEVVPSLNQYWRYCKTKNNPRNNEVLDSILDCIKIIEGKFQEIRNRDILYETNSKKDFVKSSRKKMKTKKEG